jgi:hypothetical protein
MEEWRVMRPLDGAGQDHFPVTPYFANNIFVRAVGSTDFAHHPFLPAAWSRLLERGQYSALRPDFEPGIDSDLS